MNEEEVQIRKRLLLDEYEIQHFEFIKYAIKCNITTMHEEMEKCIATKLKLSEEKEKILNIEINTLTQTYLKVLENSLQKNEESIRNFFCIPQNILLPNDKLNEEYMEIDEQKILNEIEDLKRQYLKEKSMSFLFEDEIKHLNSTSELQEQVSKLLKLIENIPDSKKSIAHFHKLYNLYNDLLCRFDNECDIKTERILLLNHIAPS